MVQTVEMPHAAPLPITNGDGPPAMESLGKIGGRRSSDLRSGSARASLEQGAASPPATEELPGAWPLSPSANGLLSGFGGKDGSAMSVPNGERARRVSGRRSGGNLAGDGEKRAGESVKGDRPRPGAAEEGYFATPAATTNGKPVGPQKLALGKTRDGGTEGVAPLPRTVSHSAVPMTPNSSLSPVKESSPASQADGMLKPPTQSHRASSPPAFGHDGMVPSRPERLQHRHTLVVPTVSTGRTSKDGSDPTSAHRDSTASASGRFTPSTPTRRHNSLQLTRRATRSVNSDMALDQVPQDEEAARWTEHIRAKRALKRQRVDTDDERVVVGTKVDQNHANYETAYNMLTGIRISVSRVNAKLDHPVNDGDFSYRQKFVFDITGNELTPGSKFDFKFKDYAPHVFRHLRAIFRLDPADYLMSLTAKYILSELGSPGKSGSFFYFSRDYKYIIKTIHHGEHKFLRKILKDYYNHVKDNTNTLLSQFYGLHRVKTKYGRKIHFVVMNNLFPPHRDIHRTFDLKGSTIGRDFREEDLEKNPRATLKDLNWLRRNLRLEFGPTKKEAFVTQMQRDVALLQRLKIMDYSLLVGIHDLERGNEENLRDKTLQVFQPGGQQQQQQSQQAPSQMEELKRPEGHHLARTPSKMENEQRARELRSLVKKERPVPMDQTLDRMPDAVQQSHFYFYADDGGFRATHEDDRPGEEIYYLGIIDCLTRYNIVKKAEHFWKGLGGHESQISPIPPERYGDRFVRFISGITMSRERAEKTRLSATLEQQSGVVVPPGIEGTVNDPRLGGVNQPLSPVLSEEDGNPAGTAEVMEKAQRMADKSRKHGTREADIPERSITTARSPGEAGLDAATLPVIGEAAESGSNASRTPSKASQRGSEAGLLTKESEVNGAAEEPATARGGSATLLPPAAAWEDATETTSSQPPARPPTHQNSATNGDDRPTPFPSLPPIESTPALSVSPSVAGLTTGVRT